VYGTPPLEVTTGGGVFTTRLLPRSSETERQLHQLNEKVLRTFGLQNGVSHTEFIRSREDGTFYFLETSARVGGANIADLIEAGTGMNMWAEWAKVLKSDGWREPGYAAALICSSFRRHLRSVRLSCS
jgi:biotin carboxylase